MNKVHYDFNIKKSINVDKSEWIYKENAVPPIVDEQLWQDANDMMDKRVFILPGKEDEERHSGRYIGKYALSSKIICSECGEPYWVRRYYKKGKKIEKVWSCSTYLRHGRLTPGHCSSPKWTKVESTSGCDNIHLNYNQMNDVLLELSGYFRFDKRETKRNLMAILKETFEEGDEYSTKNIESLLSDVINKRELLLDAYLDKMIDEATYRKKDEKLALQESQLQSKISKEPSCITVKKDSGDRLNILEKEIDNILDQELALDFICRHINKITVYREKLDIEFDILPKCEVKIERINYRKIRMILNWNGVNMQSKT